MTSVSVLGLGAMGSRMAANLIRAGFDVTVWNRESERARPLLQAGARWAPSARVAAADADFVLTMLRDDDASRQVWLDEQSGALASMRGGAIAIESSTLTPGWIAELSAAVAARGIEFLEAPVAGSLPQAAAAQLIHLVGGDAGTLVRAEKLLQALGSATHLVGPVGHGALAKLATNTLLGLQVTALAELIGLLKKAGADPGRIFETVAATPVWSPAAQRVLGLMLAGEHTSQFPVALVEKDFTYTVQAAGSPAVAPVIAAARDVFRAALDAGWGADNMTSVARLY